jgi:hypothetical protein
MSHRNAESTWASTYESAWVLLASTQVMKGTGELSGEFDYFVELNEKPLVAGEAVGSTQFTPVDASVPIAGLYPNEPNMLKISRGEGTGRLYYNAHLKVYRPVEEITPLEQGVTITRSYYSSAEDCLEETCAPIQQIENGQLVTVRLTLNIPETAYYLVVDDFIPAGAEIIDIGLNTSQEPIYTANTFYEQGWGWWEFGTPRIFDDHISWAATQLAPGTYELVYHLATLQPGEYRVLPPSAYQLYFPEVQGNGEGEVFEIRE